MLASAAAKTLSRKFVIGERPPFIDFFNSFKELQSNYSYSKKMAYRHQLSRNPGPVSCQSHVYQ